MNIQATWISCFADIFVLTKKTVSVVTHLTQDLQKKVTGKPWFFAYTFLQGRIKQNKLKIFVYLLKWKLHAKIQLILSNLYFQDQIVTHNIFKFSPSIMMTPTILLLWKPTSRPHTSHLDTSLLTVLSPSTKTQFLLRTTSVTVPVFPLSFPERSITLNKDKIKQLLMWNSQSREHQKYLWNAIVLREISQ